MFRTILLTLSRNLSALTPDVYPVLLNNFNKSPQVSTLGEYFVPENLVEIFNMVRETSMNPINKIKMYE